jgi:hypothetical protein
MILKYGSQPYLKFRLIELLDTIDSTNHQHMEFPNDWQQRPAWKK